MKILVICTGYYDRANPIQDFPYSQIQGLSSLGHDVRVLLIDGRFITHTKQIGMRNDSINGISTIGIVFPFGFMPYMLQKRVVVDLVYMAYKKISKTWIPDVIHSHFGVVAYGATKIIQNTGIPFFVTEHYSKMNMLVPEKHIYEMSKSAYNYATGLISVSHCLAQNLKFSTGLDFTVIPNAMNGEFLNAPKTQEKKDICRIVSAGTLIPEKNFSLLIYALSMIKNTSFVLSICGEGPEEKRLKKLVEELNMERIVEFKGYMSKADLRNEYSSSDLFVMLSESETFGVVFIEAMAMGLPIVSLRCGGTDDIVSEENGVIIESNDPGVIAERIREIISNLKKYDRKIIRRMAIEKYSPINVAKLLEKEYYGGKV